VRFDDAFRADLKRLFAWRRDVRRFRRDPISEDLIRELVQVTAFAPSVGYSQPSRFVRVEDVARRDAIIAEYERCNREAAQGYSSEQHERYVALKLAGLREAPVHLAVFVDAQTSRGSGLGRQTMPETLAYSTVLAIYTLWLTARAMGVGVGWVSILDPAAVARILEVPTGWFFVAYLCLGYPEEEHLERELARAGWESEDRDATVLYLR
jgi:5,6-dimethylbenzimidazole synthase